MINPTYLARVTRSSTSWDDAKKRVFHAYRRWLRAAPEIQSMYTLPFPIYKIRHRIRREFEMKRYVADLQVVDTLLAHSDREFQETMNYWKQYCHILKYFDDEEVGQKLPRNFIQAFLQGRN